jgi:aspartyl-tRNA(Asn)/glutamyl-tRNA(Gln) amidotransferase subunit A
MVFADHPFKVSAPSRTRILYVPRFGTSPVDPEIADRVASAARHLSDLGHSVEEGDAPFDVDAVGLAWPVFSQVGLAWLIGSRTDWRGQVSPGIEQMATSGLAISATGYYAAMDTLKALQSDLSVLFGRYDLIMTPTAAALPWPAREVFPSLIAGQKVGPRGHAIFTAFANMAGCPGISIPADHSSTGLPIGFQLVAAPGRDGQLCSIAAQYESAHPWADRRPCL